MRLLIVDDHPMNLKLLRAQLEAEGHAVLEAANGAEALNVLERERVDGIVSDILMPVVDGFRLCLEVRKSPQWNTLPFILYTSTYESPEDRQLARDVGADDYLTKPSPTSAIEAALEKASGKMRNPVTVSAARHDETHVLKQYSEALVRKLEERNLEVESALRQVNAAYEELRATEAKFRALIENSYDSISMLSEHGRVIYRSPATSRMLGYTMNELLGQNAFDLVHPDDLIAAKRMFQALLADQSAIVRGTLRYRSRDGAWLWLEGTGRNLLALPEVGAIVVNHRDVTGQREAEEGQRESEARFRQIAENIREVFWLTDRTKNEMLYVSPAYEAIWGRSSASLRESPRAWLDAIHPEDRERVLQAALTKQAGGTYAEEYRICRPDGSIRWIRDRAFPVGDDNGKVFRIAGVAEDVTERRLQEERIENLSRVRAFSSEINSAIVRCASPQELFDAACRIAVEHGKFGIAWIGRYDAENREVSPVASAGLEEDSVLMHEKLVMRENTPQRYSMLGVALLERRPIYNNDIASDAAVGGKRRQEALRRGYRSASTLPLIVGGEVYGSLSLFAKEPEFFNDEELGLLTELAGNISFAIEHMARQEKLEKLSRIRAVSGEINAAQVRIRDREALLRETCRIASEHGKFELVWIGRIDAHRQEIRPVAWTGFSEEIAHRVSWKSIGTAQGTLGEAIRTRKPAVRNDIETQLPAGGMRAEAMRQGCRSTVCLPLLVDDSVVALVALFAAGTGFFDADELALLDELAADVSFGLQSIAQQEKVEYLSYYDTITGLPNRRLFMDRVRQQLHSRGGEPFMVVLMVLNLQRFRIVNESYGRNAGDDLLKEVTRRLTNAMNGADHLARVGADNFGIVMRGVPHATAVVHTIENQVLPCFHEPFKLNGAELRIAARVGIAMFPADGADVDSLFGNAEAALKKARASGETCLFYAAEMNAKAAQVLSLETRLRKAVEAQQFVLYYQPKIRLSTGEICGMEALIRWQEPGAGLVPPGAFIPILEETGLIIEVGRWALGRALADHRDWTARGLLAPRIAVNVSAIQLQRRDFADTVIEIVQREGDNPDALELEVTESLLMRDVRTSIGALTILRGLGIRIAMDDFGTGYSSLSYLARLPIDSLKIDRSFVNAMSGNPQDMAIVTTIIALAHSLSLKVVAEGVETKEQARTLKLLKCNEAQGYLYSKPVPAAEIEAMLRGTASR